MGGLPGMMNGPILNKSHVTRTLLFRLDFVPVVVPCFVLWWALPVSSSFHNAEADSIPSGQSFIWNGFNRNVKIRKKKVSLDSQDIHGRITLWNFQSQSGKKVFFFWEGRFLDEDHHFPRRPTLGTNNKKEYTTWFQMDGYHQSCSRSPRGGRAAGLMG